MAYVQVTTCDICNTKIEKEDEYHHIFIEKMKNENRTGHAQRLDICKGCKHNISFQQILIASKLDK